MTNLQNLTYFSHHLNKICRNVLKTNSYILFLCHKTRQENLIMVALSRKWDSSLASVRILRTKLWGEIHECSNVTWEIKIKSRYDNEALRNIQSELKFNRK